MELSENQETPKRTPPDEWSYDQTIRLQEQRPSREIGKDRQSQLAMRKSKNAPTSPDPPFVKCWKHDQKIFRQLHSLLYKTSNRKIQRRTLKNRLEYSSSFWMAKVLEYTLFINKNGQVSDAPQFRCSALIPNWFTRGVWNIFNL